MTESVRYLELVIGNIAYIIVAISWLLTNILWLRVAAIAGMAFEVTYYLMQPGETLWTSIAWDGVFISINLVQLGILLRDRMSLKLTREERVYLAPVLERLDKAQIARMLRTGGWKTLEQGTAITRENEPVADLVLICAGRAEVTVRDAVIAHVGPGVFVGEIAFTTGRNATATVYVTETSRVLALDQQKLHALCTQDRQIASAIFHLVGGGLADKMHASNERMQTVPEAGEPL